MKFLVAVMIVMVVNLIGLSGRSAQADQHRLAHDEGTTPDTLMQDELLTFHHGQHQLMGHYLAPVRDLPPKAVLLFVHGDGAFTYDAEGYYDVFWDRLRRQGYGVFSWDKPGVGESSGNWLQQSMQDRQGEVRAAIRAVKQRYLIPESRIGLIGFSQAGWVIPALASGDSNIGFAIGIGFAANWIQQGQYYTRKRLAFEGASAAEIEQALAGFAAEVELFEKAPEYAVYRQYKGAQAMNEARYGFVLRNYRADASADYQRIEVPVLLLWGDQDANVDARAEYQRWQTRKSSPVTPRLIPNATHGLLKANRFQGQTFGLWSWLKLMWWQQDALAPEVMPVILDFLEHQTR
ncbi:hydrolase of the alpha/beta superfamily protein [Oleiphilus messinensis]|uniref:Hydrolase of the alpha/beta superfamily protein n=1 Tax=Oleiphilus messinensis TaxID=141451 RepID=A0A1Y0II91_9GAMM|nr:alpha/beta fold hydrolase [Oleiphilus messinensis]ARU59235.1 hydrolase of the alpha/beta superfamily protein [Oleiphilus messinensis]